MLYLTLSFFFFNDTATTDIYTLSLHDALPIYPLVDEGRAYADRLVRDGVNTEYCNYPDMVHGFITMGRVLDTADRKSTRLNSSHEWISYAVFCLKKKKIMNIVMHSNRTKSV